MKTSIQFATGLVLAAAALAASASIARAGEAGAAGSIAAQFTTITVGTVSTPNVLSGLSGAVAVGKSSAATGARTLGATDTFASAFGAAGTLTITNANQVPVAASGTGPTAVAAVAGIGYSVAEDGALGTSQANSLSGTGVGKATLKFTDSVTTSGIALP